jgi:hypothetical protein
MLGVTTERTPRGISRSATLAHGTPARMTTESAVFALATPFLGPVSFRDNWTKERLEPYYAADEHDLRLQPPPWDFTIALFCSMVSSTSPLAQLISIGCNTFRIYPSPLHTVHSSFTKPTILPRSRSPRRGSAALGQLAHLHALSFVHFPFRDSPPNVENASISVSWRVRNGPCISCLLPYGYISFPA